MARIYAVVFENVSVGTAAQDLFEISPADDKPCIVHGLILANVGGTADAGDAQEELIRLTVKRGHTTGGSGGSAFTPLALNPDDPAAGFAAEINNTTVASAGTAVNLLADGWNVRVPYQMFWTPETRPIVKQGQVTLVVRSESTLADAITMSGTLYVEEV